MTAIDNTIQGLAVTLERMKPLFSEINRKITQHGSALLERDGRTPKSLDFIASDLFDLAIRFNSVGQMIKAGHYTRDPEDIALSLGEIDDLTMKFKVLRARYQEFSKRNPYDPGNHPRA